nr:MAG TPA: hypothetical protein [Caudoviricetes sp.]
MQSTCDISSFLTSLCVVFMLFLFSSSLLFLFQSPILYLQIIFHSL